jgi:glucokinase
MSLYSETIRSSFRSCNTCFMLLYKLSKLVLSPLKCCTLATVKNSLQVYLNHHRTMSKLESRSCIADRIIRDCCSIINVTWDIEVNTPSYFY